MQSRPTEVPQTSSESRQPQEQHSRQYGFDSHDDQTPQLSSGGEGGGECQGLAPNGVPVESRTTGRSGIDETPSRRLSTAKFQLTGPPAEPGTECEEELTLPTKGQSRDGFKTKKSRKGALSLENFPNGRPWLASIETPHSSNTISEVLTHILSHLPPSSLSSISSVSQRFHSLVTTPHAWRIAFSRYFPGRDALEASEITTEGSSDGIEGLVSEKRVFTRLTTLASWRSEYILRTRLLRSLARGKPALFEGLTAGASSRSGPGHSGNAQVTYNSGLFSTVNHIHATYGTEPNKRFPRFIHGADEIGAASSSDPSHGKADRWGSLDPHSFLQFTERFPGEAQYGLGPGDVVGLPNPMDVSQPFGMVQAEGSPGGLVYFRSIEEQRGRLLAASMSYSSPDLGIPKLNASSETVCSVWIAKSSAVPTMTNNLVGILVGSSFGILTAYSLGTNTVKERRLERGEVTARWVLSPGVPIIAIMVDANFSPKRLAQRRIWIVVLNALGEVFYLTDLPSHNAIGQSVKLNEQKLDELAWETGRTVGWLLVEPTRRQARNDPFERSDFDGSYSPRSSWDGMALGKGQISAETKEIESFIKQKPKHFQKICEGWDMRRRLEVDFAGDCGNEDGEAIVVCGCGLDDNSVDFRRYTRCRLEQNIENTPLNDLHPPSPSPKGNSGNSMFGGSPLPAEKNSSWSFSAVLPKRSSSAHSNSQPISTYTIDEWRVSNLSFGGLKATQVTTTALDESIFAILTVSEDPLLSLGGSSNTSSPLASPLGKTQTFGSAAEIPGQRARFMAAGTKLGTVLIWNLRAAVSSNTEMTNTIQAVRIIYTDSPQISCLALTALYLVHGGNDGLVQAWDLLASHSQPVRTLNSRFSSRARRRLVQAEASVQGVGINLFAAGALCLDPDPTVLRGMVSLGTHLRYWSYSSSAADQYKSSKRRTRRSERGSNQGGDKFSVTGRGVLQDYIANERADLEREKQAKRKEQERLAGRFGLDLLGSGASDDEILAYATLLSEEAARNDEIRRNSESEGSVVAGSSTVVPNVLNEEEPDADIAEAIRLSLQEIGVPAQQPESEMPPRVDFALRYIKKRHSPSTSPPRGGAMGSSSRHLEESALAYAVQLSLAEEARRQDIEEEFPVLSRTPSPPSGKGKGIRKPS